MRLSVKGDSDVVGVGTAVSRSFLSVSSRPDGSQLSIPVITVTGSRSGPTMLVVSGIHGDEQEGLVALLDLVEELGKSEFSGRLIAITALNFPAFEARRRGNPLDEWYYDMNRLFPGNAQGSITERIAHRFSTQLLPQADLVLSVHSGGSHMYCPVRLILADDSPQTLELAWAMGPKWNLVAKMAGDKAKMADLGAYASRLGKPCLTIELGGLSSRPKDFGADVDTLMCGIRNAMKHYRMLPGRARYSAELLRVDSLAVRNNHAGLLRVAPETWSSSELHQGTLLGTVLDVLGNTLEEIRAPVDCVVVGRFGCKSLPGATQIGSVGRIVERLRR